MGRSFVLAILNNSPGMSENRPNQTCGTLKRENSPTSSYCASLTIASTSYIVPPGPALGEAYRPRVLTLKIC